MKFRTVSVDWLLALVDNGCISKAVASAMRSSLAAGGYVSGSFARTVAYAYFFPLNGKQFEGREDLFGRYRLQYRHYGRSIKPEESRLWKAGTGDIDFFFPDQKSGCDAVSIVRSTCDAAYSAPTMGGYGHEFVLGDNILQLITRVTGAPEDVIESFDIFNAKVYLDSSSIHYPEGWVAAEKARTLGIDRTDRPNFLWRVTKWFHSHRYEKFRPGDETKYVDGVFAAAALVKSGGWRRWGRDVKMYEVLSKGKYFVSKLPPDQLLKMSMLYDSYDQMNMTKILLSKGRDANP